MSRQFRVYLLPSDIDSLMCELKKRIAFKVLQESSPTAEPFELESPVQARSIIFRSPQVSSVRCYIVPLDVRVLDIRHYPTVGKWIIQPSSDAVEFSGCDFDGNTLMVGRFYFQTDMLIDGMIRPKKVEFIKWGADLFRLVKKCLRRDTELDAYVGIDAAKFREREGRFASFIKSNGEIV